MPNISRAPFGATKEGFSAEIYTLANDNGVIAKVTNYGAILTEFWVPSSSGNSTDVVMGFDELEPYETKSPHFGGTIGRVGNRIAGGRFELDGRVFQMAQNNGSHHLHGGVQGYDRRVWTANPSTTEDSASVSFFLLDPDGEQGYPGTVEAWVTYTLTNDNVLRLEYRATTDQATPINLTNHTYWNLKDGGASDILPHVVKINADAYTGVDETLIPTGQLDPVVGTPFDFRSAKAIEKDFAALGNQPLGYDHNFVLRSGGGSLAMAADVLDPQSGRRMETWTTQPGVQFYTGNFLTGALYGKGGIQYSQHHAFCLETQHFPDSVNHPHFPSMVLRPGETYAQTTEYRFFW